MVKSEDLDRNLAEDYVLYTAIEGIEVYERQEVAER